MDRLACVNLIDLPMQLLLRRHPDWQPKPVAVVDRDQPTGIIQWVNKYARRARISPGMRYKEALSLNRKLQAATVTDADIADSVEANAKRLLDYTPFVEAADGQPGIFWLDATGLDRLFGSFDTWAQAVSQKLLDAADLYTTVVVGFSRFGTWALARAKRGGILVVSGPDNETRRVDQVSLDTLHIDPAFRDRLQKLDIHTVADFLELPADGVRRRFDTAAYLLYRRARGDLAMPLTPYQPDDAPVEHLNLDRPESVTTRLIFWIKRYLHPLLAKLERRQDKLTRLEVSFVYEADAGVEHVEVRPAAPTCQEDQLLDLLRLRLDALDWRAGVVEVELRSHTTRADHDQVHLFVDDQTRDLSAANQALAQLRAEFGDQAVVYARLQDAHLPEASYRWEPIDHLDKAQPDATDHRALIRRICGRPEPMARSRLEGNDRLELDGPFIISGGWWAGGVHRDYHFLRSPDGAIAWVYWDAMRQRWFRHGELE